MGNCYSERINECFSNYEDMQTSTIRNNIAINITSDMVTSNNISQDIKLEICTENEQPKDIKLEITVQPNENISNEKISNGNIPNGNIPEVNLEKSIIIEQHFEESIITSPKNVEDGFEMIN